MNLYTDYYVVWLVRIALALWCIPHAIAILDGIVNRLKR
jgi:hypothetical protein